MSAACRDAGLDPVGEGGARRKDAFFMDGFSDGSTKYAAGYGYDFIFLLSGLGSTLSLTQTMCYRSLPTLQAGFFDQGSQKTGPVSSKI